MATSLQTNMLTTGLAPIANAATTNVGGLPALGASNSVAPAASNTSSSLAASNTPAAASAPVSLTWLKPLMTIGGPALTVGGGFAAMRGISKGSGWLKYAGIGAALSGIGMTILGNRQAGIEKGTKATEQQALVALQTMQTQYEQAMTQVSNTAAQQIAAFKQQIAQSGVSSAAIGANGATSSASWSLQGLIGSSVQLTAGNSSGGATIADAGNFRIEQIAGDANGYSTMEDANAAARASMSTETIGSRFERRLVLEHDGKFYGVIAKKLTDGEQASALQAAQGNVVAWSALNHIEENGEPGWQVYAWSQKEGSQSAKIPYGTTTIFASSNAQVGGGGPVSANTATTSTPTVSVSNVGIGERQKFNPNTQIGRSFSINASNSDQGVLARGGTLQIQQFITSSTGGFGTVQDAAIAARAARSSDKNQNSWSRWVTMQGSDGRFYVYKGSIVNKETAEVQAAPVHIFGAKFAEFFDAGNGAWKAMDDI